MATMASFFGGGVAVAAEAQHQPVVAGLEPPVGADRGPGGLDQQGLEVLAAFAGLAVLAFAGGFVVARAQPGPRRQVRVGGEELTDVHPDLGDDRRGRHRADPRDRDQQVRRCRERDHHLLHLRVQPGDHLVQLGDVLQVQLAHQRVMVTEPAFQRLRQVSDLRAHHGPRASSASTPRGPFPGDQRPDHRPPGHRVDRRSHRVQLDPGVLQHPAHRHLSQTPQDRETSRSEVVPRHSRGTR